MAGAPEGLWSQSRSPSRTYDLIPDAAGGIAFETATGYTKGGTAFDTAFCVSPLIADGGTTREAEIDHK